MAKVKVSESLPLAPHRAWTAVADLADLGSWLVLHEAWRSEVPEDLTVGTRIVGVARAKGLRNRVVWTVVDVAAPHRLMLSGDGKGGVRYGLAVSVDPDGGGSAVTVELDMGGRALFGPIGSAAARAVKGDIQRSLENFARRYA